MPRPRLRLFVVALAATVATLSAATGGGLALISRDDLKTWLTYIASDALEGRALYSTGLGLAAGYIEGHLEQWNVRPAGDPGSYLQTVDVLGVKRSGHPTVTVQVGNDSRTFADADVVFPRFLGRKRTLTIDHVEFVGYGVDAPRMGHADYAGKNLRDAAVVWLGMQGPRDIDAGASRIILNDRDEYAIDAFSAAATIGPLQPGANGRGAAAPAAQAAGRGRANQIPAADFTTVRRLDAAVAPAVSVSDAFFEFLFSRAPVKYAELKSKADAQQPLPSFRLDGVKLTFNLSDDYEVVRTQLAHNVVAIVEGSDPQLKNTYVAFGAHYDHVGYAQGEVVSEGGSRRRLGAPVFGFVKPGNEDDRIWNGADDDGSGTVALMALARAFAEGPRPRRSLLFVWHTGEESGRYGSLYFADHPTVPIDSIVAQLNVDMIGRNRDDRSSESNTVYLVGSDRISSELHDISREANAALAPPMTLNYEFNDPGDPEQLYFRSDHFSYAEKGIPVIFFTTGLHPDYHTNADEVSKIEFDKMVRVTDLIYETGWRLANLDHAPARDNKGPRTW